MNPVCILESKMNIVKKKTISESLRNALISGIPSLKNRTYLLTAWYCLLQYSCKTRVSESVVKFKSIYGCSCCTALDLSDRLTHTAGERKTFLRMKTVSGQTGLMKNLYKTTRMFPLIPPPPFIITRGWKNKYL